jgi:sucrose-6-phosphate hydrolase SacC (GH32 family)
MLLKQVFLICCFGIIYCNTAFCQNQIAAWHLDETAGMQTMEAMSGNTFTVKNDYPKTAAEWGQGVNANALRFNGYATWVEGTFSTTLPSQMITLSAWIAPDAYPLNSAAIFTNASLSGGGMYLAIDKFGRLEAGATVNGQFVKKTSTQKIQLWEWSSVAVTIDAAAGAIYGYINGVQVLQQNTAPGLLSWPSLNLVKIGKFHTQSLAGIYETGLFCGLIDDVKIVDQSLSANQLTTIYQNELPQSAPAMAIPTSRFDGDPHRPIFHSIPAANWMNEPHGLIYFNGLYHIFYQKNGNGPYWGRLNWGHQTSPDLVTWTEQKIVLSPDPDTYDKEGCWSGCSFAADGKAFIMYTGVDGATAQMCVAEGNTDASEYQKFSGNPVVLNPPAPYTPNDFRDPYIWEEAGIFYMVIGTGNSVGGAALLYKSTDHVNWQYLYPLKRGINNADNSGVFWELPAFMTFGNKRVFTAQPVPHNGVSARILYWTGNFENEYFTPDQSQPKQLEPGDALLGVTSTTDTLGRTIAIGIIPDILPDFEQRKNGWANTCSLPRIWSLSSDGTTLLQKPLPELEKLRGEHHHLEQVDATDGQAGLLAGIQGRYLEINTTIDPGTAKKAGLSIATSPDGFEKTNIYWDIMAGIVVIDRIHSSINSNAPSSFLTANLPQTSGQPLNFHIFLDGSVLEVFINDERALSTRIYPEKPESTGLELYVTGGTATFTNVDIWNMKNMHDPSVTATKTPVVLKKNTIEQVYPNPSSGSFFVAVNLPDQGEVYTRLINTLGGTVTFQSLGQLDSGAHLLSFDQPNLPAGIYFLQILFGEEFSFAKIYIVK